MTVDRSKDAVVTRTLADRVELPCGQHLDNRLMKSALSEALSDREHGPSERLRQLYSAWSVGGFGLVVTGNVMVDRTQLGEPGNVVIEDDRHLDGLRQWAKSFQDGGTPIWMQINHPGRQANALISRQRPVAPSAVGTKSPGAVKPRALESVEIEDIIERYATAAAVAETAGFDGVQIHGAHGYLVTQFLSPLANQRDDQWGGDAARRRRFVLEIVAAIKANVAPGFAIGIKLNSADFQRGGFSEGESRDVVRALVDGGIDMIEVSGGTYESPAMMGTVRASTRAREAYFLDYAATVRDIAGDVPVAVTGGFRTRAAMEAAVQNDECDIVGLGRATCTNPEAGHTLLRDGAAELPVQAIRFGARSLVGRLADLKALDGALDLQWHTDQLHRIGGGLTPDPARPWWRTVGSLLRRNGWGALRSRRG